MWPSEVHVPACVHLHRARDTVTDGLWCVLVLVVSVDAAQCDHHSVSDHDVKME